MRCTDIRGPHQYDGSISISHVTPTMQQQATAAMEALLGRLSASTALKTSTRAGSGSKSWRECEGVEPSRDGEGRPATVLKTAKTTGPHPLPSSSIADDWKRGVGKREVTGGSAALRAAIDRACLAVPTRFATPNGLHA